MKRYTIKDKQKNLNEALKKKNIYIYYFQKNDRLIGGFSMTTMQDNGMILLMCQKKIIPFIEFHTKKKKSRTNVIEKKFKQTKSLPWAH